MLPHYGSFLSACSLGSPCSGLLPNQICTRGPLSGAGAFKNGPRVKNCVGWTPRGVRGQILSRFWSARRDLQKLHYFFRAVQVRSRRCRPRSPRVHAGRTISQSTQLAWRGSLAPNSRPDEPRLGPRWPHQTSSQAPSARASGQGLPSESDSAF